MFEQISTIKKQQQFIHSKVSFDIKDNAVETRANLEFWTNCNKDIQLLYQIFKKIVGFARLDFLINKLLKVFVIKTNTFTCRASTIHS